MTAPPLPPEPPLPNEARLQQLSVLADGELDSPDDGVSAALAAWKLDGDARQAWHTYHLIGDVMRSADLASRPAQDLAFMSQLRERLQAEPSHLARVQPAPPRTGRLMGWPAGVTLAASVAVVAVVLTVNRASAPDAAGVDVQALAVNDTGVLRNPRLDEFLRLHQMARGGLLVSAPGGTLQRADLQMPAGAGR